MNEIKTNGVIIRKSNFIRFCENYKDTESKHDKYTLYLCHLLYGDANAPLTLASWTQDGSYKAFYTIAYSRTLEWHRDEAKQCEAWLGECDKQYDTDKRFALEADGIKRAEFDTYGDAIRYMRDIIKDGAGKTKRFTLYDYARAHVYHYDGDGDLTAE